MEVRDAKVIFNKSGGTSSQGGYTTRVTIPISWIKQMGISPDDREITISFDGDKIDGKIFVIYLVFFCQNSCPATVIFYLQLLHCCW